MDKLKIGLLPMYIEMYDRDMPQIRPGIDKFRETILHELEMRGLEVEAAPVCRVKREFAQAISLFEEHEVDAVVTLHLAYSPSLESSDVLAATKLPLIVLDTTPAYNFNPSQDMEEINYNHGIHGVQDMCNLLKRNKKEFFLEVGHWEKSDVLDRIVGCVKAIKIAKQIRKARVGRIGQPFDGMGDFLVPAETMRSTIGIETVLYDCSTGRTLVEAVSDNEINAELTDDREKFDVNGLDIVVHKRSTIANLAVRKWIEQEKLTAFTVNFLAVDSNSGLSCMPFESNPAIIGEEVL